jgi:Flp pilus assembly protein TadB
MTPLIPAIAGAMIVAGLIGMVVALRPAPVPTARPARNSGPAQMPSVRFHGLSQRTRTTTVLGAGAGLLVALLTGWIIAIVLVPAAIIGMPYLLSAPPSAAKIGRLEAMEEWARSLSGKLSVGQSLRSALQRSLPTAPEPIQPEITRLVNRLRNQTASTEDALRLLAEDLDDSTGDLLVANLIIAARGRGTGLAPALEALAESVAADVRARRQIEADQQKPRSTARTVTVITMGVLGVLAFTGDYIEPYGSPLGQMILAILLSAYVGSLILLRRMAVSKPIPRFLDLKARTSA